MRDKVEEVLNQIRPSLMMDEGNVELVDVDDGVVKVRLTGACSGCAMSTLTLKMGIENTLKEEDLFSFDAGTEACLSISGIVEYAREGYNGVVNVYPFTCMPSTTTSAIVKPLMNKLGVPYLDTPYDSSFQPGREAAIRTFMYQAHQHFNRHGRKSHI